eukprot:TRINITY_DN14461_c0_g2_i2.p1 TRINITY_DN14461_c0_g2~~TRINITY_DN14461_c0_g2_i2.p1  ORF type:complete len:250 (+),score=66.39 TRINITY_DN14461_c0_g2_i2:88-837(+)
MSVRWSARRPNSKTLMTGDIPMPRSSTGTIDVTDILSKAQEEEKRISIFVQTLQGDVNTNKHHSKMRDHQGMMTIGLDNRRTLVVEKMNEQLRSIMQEVNETERRRAEAERDEAERHKKMRQSMMMESSLPAGALTKQQQDRRTLNLSAIMKEAGGELTEEFIEQWEARELRRDEEERRARLGAMNVRENRIRDLGEQLKEKQLARTQSYAVWAKGQLQAIDECISTLEAEAAGHRRVHIHPRGRGCRP